MLPPRAILVAIDFSDASRRAFSLATQLAVRCGARLHLLHVADPALVSAAAHHGIELTTEARGELQRFIEAQPSASELRPTCHVVVGPAAEAIVTIADREQADLVVIAAHGWSGPRCRPLGSVAQEVVLRASRSVLVVPDGWSCPNDPSSPLVGPVVVGVDRTETSAVAIGAAAALARALHTSVELVHVVGRWPAPERWAPLAAEVIHRRIDLAHREIGGRVAVLAPTLGPLAIDTGDIAERLAAAVTPSSTRQPLLVLGRSSRQTADGYPGTIAERVATVAKSPVLMFVGEPD